MNILISGATSMIGSKLSNHLSSKNKVFCLVRKQSKNIFRLVKNANIIFVDCEADNFDKIDKLIDDRIDVAVNFYWEGIRGNDRNNKLLQEKSFNNSIKFLNSSVRLGAKNIIGVGSQAEYGPHDFYNEDVICKPVCEYGNFKNSTREYYQKFCKENNINFKWARIFSAYGEFDFEGSLVMTSIKKFKENSTITLKSGSQIRNYTYDEDLVRAFTCLIYDNEKSGVYNITRIDNKRLVEYLFILKKILHSSSKIISLNSDKDNEMSIKTDSRLFENDFHFKFDYDFSNGILDMLRRLGVKYE